ncbi:hypothetical protein [Streptomyces gardneri]|uniref:ATP-binding protein n=1 Tax=Streptomyces gardneri TaxID=66892 RepID=A0A4Y3RN53_9ACTN|nr:hypothetical protein [Streptomyces gardneri]ALO09414.1 hypothetical protein AQF52_3820 [Streptomyces venezuelae]QPK46521.1 hypothetical protein H4W23_19055 [Streptomyces gardneri]WRK37910.1 hypothetical protein U0M97_19150 [Streptomyces venezuelae]CUM40172.1 hypothetical protein BN2537_9309 [Streptomyces venezuelae]GEB58754.1 hypothetical protein SGA01_43590 [Streptomyces gardneri]
MNSSQRVLTALALAASAIGLGAGAAAAADPLAGATGLLGPVSGAATQPDSPLSAVTGGAATSALPDVTSALPL